MCININLKKKKSLANPLHRSLAVIRTKKCQGLSGADTLTSETHQFVTLEPNVRFAARGLTLTQHLR